MISKTKSNKGILKLVQLEAPYDSWNQPSTQVLFCKMVGLKLESYLTRYSYGILPFDGSDFVATHLLICEESPNGELTPLTSYKSITLERCEAHNLVFPCLSILQASQAERHTQVITDLLKRYQKNPSEISYDSGFTIHPSARIDRAFCSELKDLLMGFVTLHAIDKGIRCLVGMGMTHVKADQYFLSWGYEPFEDGQGPLPLVKVKSHFWKESQLFRAEKFTEFAMMHAKLVEPFWERRLVISSRDQKIPSIAA